MFCVGWIDLFTESHKSDDLLDDISSLGIIFFIQGLLEESALGPRLETM